MIEPDHPDLSIGQQCALLPIPHSSFCYIPQDETERNPSLIAPRGTEGDSKLEVIRVLKRYIAREVYCIIMRRQIETNMTRIAA